MNYLVPNQKPTMWVGHSCPTPLTLALPLWVGPNSASTSKASDRNVRPTHNPPTRSELGTNGMFIRHRQFLPDKCKIERPWTKPALSEVEGNVRGTPAELHTSCQTSQAKPRHSSTYIPSAYLLLECTTIVGCCPIIRNSTRLSLSLSAKTIESLLPPKLVTRFSNAA